MFKLTAQTRLETALWKHLSSHPSTSQRKRLFTSLRSQRATIQSPDTNLQIDNSLDQAASPVPNLRKTSYKVLQICSRITNSNSRMTMSLILLYFYRNCKTKEKLLMLILFIVSMMTKMRNQMKNQRLSYPERFKKRKKKSLKKLIVKRGRESSKAMMMTLTPYWRWDQECPEVSNSYLTRKKKQSLSQRPNMSLSNLPKLKSLLQSMGLRLTHLHIESMSRKPKLILPHSDNVSRRLK